MKRPDACGSKTALRRIAMNTPNLAQLKDLLSNDDAPCVSILLPTHRRHPEVQQDPIRLENLIKEAERRASLASVDRSLLDPARALLPEEAFWNHQSDGLALYCRPSGMQAFRVPATLREHVSVGPRPAIKQLLPLATSGQSRYRVLVLSQHAVRVLEGDANGLAEMHIDGLPQSVEEVVGIAEDPGLQQRSGGPGAKGSFSHGSGSTQDLQKEELEQFVRAVNDAMHRALEGRIQPLVIAAVDHVAAAFRSTTNARMLVQEGLHGNFEHLDAAELHQKAWPLVAPRFEADKQRTADLVREGLGTGKVVQRIEEVVAAARAGRIQTMLCACDVERWGALDGDSVALHDARQDQSIDLIELAVAEAILQGGEIHALRQDDMPGDDAKVAALLRW